MPVVSMMKSTVSPSFISMLAGEIRIVGGWASLTVTSTLAAIVPPGPEQPMLNVTSPVVVAVTDSEPFGAFEPTQPPEAWQEDAFVLDQVRRKNSPWKIDRALEVRVAMGAGGG